jgi:hypothetical protein
MTHVGTERNSSGKMPAVLKTAERRNRLVAGTARSSEKGERTNEAANAGTYSIAEREAFDIPI